MKKTDREGENVMQALFDAVNAICGKIQVVSDLFWEFPTNFGLDMRRSRFLEISVWRSFCWSVLEFF